MRYIHLLHHVHVQLINNHLQIQTVIDDWNTDATRVNLFSSHAEDIAIHI